MRLTRTPRAHACVSAAQMSDKKFEAHLAAVAADRIVNDQDACLTSMTRDVHTAHDLLRDVCAALASVESMMDTYTTNLGLHRLTKSLVPREQRLMRDLNALEDVLEDVKAAYKAVLVQRALVDDEAEEDNEEVSSLEL